MPPRKSSKSSKSTKSDESSPVVVETQTHTVTLTDELSLRFKCESTLEPAAVWLSTALQMVHESGAVLTEGATVQLGFGRFSIVRDADDNQLYVHEPAFDRDIVETHNDVSRSLSVCAAQMELCGRFDAEPLPCGCLSTMVIAEGVLQSTGKIFAERTPPEVDEDDPEAPEDSGWFVGFAEGGDNTKMDTIFVYQLLEIRPALLPHLMLPVGHQVVLFGDDLKALARPAAPDTHAEAPVDDVD
jgi:hypothetical protein